MPVKPRIPATIDTTKKINAHFRIVIAHHSSVRTRPLQNPSSNLERWDWFQNGCDERRLIAARGPADRSSAQLALLNPPPGGNI
jgi:hypothetical protein